MPAMAAFSAGSLVALLADMLIKALAIVTNTKSSKSSLILNNHNKESHLQTGSFFGAKRSVLLLELYTEVAYTANIPR
jgi:hypothetical protein